MQTLVQKTARPSRQAIINPPQAQPNAPVNDREPSLVPEPPSRMNARGGSPPSGSDPGGRPRNIAGRSFSHDFGEIPIHSGPSITLQTRLTLGTPGDIYEQEADRLAEKVVRSGEPVLQRKCACQGECECGHRESATEPERLQASPLPPGGGRTASVPEAVHRTLRSPGAPLEGGTREFMESRFGHDFGRVRVHTGERAAESARSVGARAYTVGSNIVFGKGEFSPSSADGRRLLAHELVHTLQQNGGTDLLQRSPAGGTSDPLCTTFDAKAAGKSVSTLANAHKSDSAVEKRQALVLALKPVLRCATETQRREVRNGVETTLGTKEADSVWTEAATPFGGYTGMYPGYAPDIRKSLTKLGANETVPFRTFSIDPSHEQPVSSKTARDVADKSTPGLARTDIIYFRGHQYAQYKAPGVFSDFEGENGFDLRFVQKKGGFPNVKLMISTSCATLCKESFEVFHGLFPNAIILGFRKSAPNQGSLVRDDFQTKLKTLGRPLLLDQPADIGAIVSSWKSIIEARYKGDVKRLPGYYDGSQVHYWEKDAWKTIGPTQKENKCYVKGDETTAFPGPP